MALRQNIMWMLRRGATTAGILLLAACGSSQDGGGTGADAGADGTAPGGDSGADAAAPGPDASSDVGIPPADGASLPDAPGDAATDGGPGCAPEAGTTFAMTQLVFGDGNNGQWKSVGFDIDGQTWTSTSTTHCQPNSGATPGTVFPSGNNGIDNSFGHNVLPILLSIAPTWVTDTNSAIQKGTFSALLELQCLPPTGDVPSMLTKLFDATALGSTPKLDGTDMWPVAPELLSNATDPESSTITYPAASVAGQVFDTGKNQKYVLPLPLATNGGTTWVTLTMSAAEVTMTLAADRKSATGGIVGGVLGTEDFVGQINQVGSALGLCNMTVLANLITTIRQASDIMSDGTQDPTKTCDGISIGLGFAMTQALRAGVGPARATQMACP